MDITVECDKCGNDLEATASTDRYGTIILKAELCQHCVEEAEEKANDIGVKEGYDDGYSDGKNDGYYKGFEEGSAEPGGNGP